MAIGDLDHENATVTAENASHASSDDEFEEGVTVAVIHPLYLSPGDTSGISLISFQLTGTDNYSLWWPKERFRKKYWYQWERCNAIVLSWLMNSVAPVLISGIAYATNAHKVWTDLQERFDKVNDTRCYNLHKEIVTLSQGTSSIFVYYLKLKDFWDESESVIPIPDCDCVKTKEFIVHLRKQKVYQFLMGLNDSYSQARIQILMMKPLPSMNQAYAMLMSDGSQRAVAGSAGILGSSPSAQRPYIDSSPQTQGSVFPFTKDQYDQIMYILNNSTSTSSAQANVAGTSTALLASTSPQEWIIDTGATNHMVLDANLLTKPSIVTPSNPRTVLLPNGDVTPVTYTGDKNISDRSTLKDVFYEPQFKFNLLSVSKVTRDLKCFASFYPDFCVFQDLFSGRVRKIGRERDGLYFLQKYGGKMLTVVSLAAAGIKSRQGDTTIDVALWHKRLGHVFSIVLRKLFAAKLASINDTINKCSVCPCARQTRLSFPSSCIKTVTAFDLIHLDVWGPYNCATFDGNRYFLTVVDDFTRMTWFFLLKLKFDVCVVLTQLIVLIQTQFNKVVKVVRSDNGSEFVNSTCTTLFQKHGIIHQRTCAYTPQQMELLRESTGIS
ncbi:uncharacterized protein LOC142168922 [Nicotiana tabacum]|uniref:Uncharacterized protein LOC142168922 n=1 Tax=Nicotiana tabacum TaxID=4097 RepID=A0AC58SMJ4_TOBAC